MSAISKPDRRREEYLCTACNMELARDVYNKLHTPRRDRLLPQLPADPVHPRRPAAGNGHRHVASRPAKPVVRRSRAATKPTGAKGEAAGGCGRGGRPRRPRLCAEGDGDVV